MSKSGFFLGLGAQKSGTTWLAEYLKGHPGVSMSPLKELHYFDSLWLPSCKAFDKKFFERLKAKLQESSIKAFHHESVKESDDGLRLRALLCRVNMIGRDDFSSQYRRYFESVCDMNRLFGEITPSYSMLRSGHFKMIDSIFPGSKYLFLMRDPVDRFWSHLRFYYKNSKVVLDRALVEKSLDDERFMARANYGRTLNELFSVVPTDRVFVGLYEDLFGRDGRAFVRRLTDFLGLSFIEPDFSHKVHVSRASKLSSSIELLLRERLDFVYSDVEALGCSSVRSAWRN